MCKQSSNKERQETCSICGQHSAMKSKIHPNKQLFLLETTFAFWSMNSCIIQMYAQIDMSPETAENGLDTKTLTAPLKG